MYNGGFYFAAYGEEEANILAREWAVRSDHFYQLWLERWGSMAYHFTPEDLESYVPGGDWLEFACNEIDNVDGPASAKFTEVSNAFPKKLGG